MRRGTVMTSKMSNSHPFLDPLWRRVLLVAAIVAWCLTELYFESYTWGMMVGIFAVYGAWSYLLTYVPSPPATPPIEPDGP